MSDAEELSSSVSRRDFLRVGGLSVVGLSMAERQALARTTAAAGHRSCIFLLMTGGPSQLETFDPKPEAPLHVRGPMKAISTAVPGLFLADGLPKLAERADRFSLIRSLNHSSPPVHETGYQWLHTGCLSDGESLAPSFGSLIAKRLGSRNGVPPYVVLPKLLSQTGVNMYRGQTAGDLGEEFDPVAPSGTGARFDFLSPDSEPASIRQKYGDSHFGRLCLQARQLVEVGVRCVVVNLFDHLAGQLTWDCHGRSASTPGTVYDYRDTLCPQFDRAVAALLDDLRDRGLIDQTMVVATGEFGRTPQINGDAGRDHWPGVWSALVAGGVSPRGAVIGASDAQASTPIDRPISPGELVCTILCAMNALESDDGDTESTSAAVGPLPILELLVHAG